MQDYGVTRICINPQTFNQKTLNLMQRKHTVEDIYKVYELAKGKFIINMDLICGLTGEDYNDFCFSLDSAIKLNPENITVHTLCLKKGSSLKEQVKRLPSGEVAKMVNYAHMRLNESGYEPYYLYRQKYMADNLENTGYAKPNTECVYNVDIMEEVSSIIACGANAVSKKISAVSAQDKIVRYGNPKDIATYIAKIDTIIKEKGEMFGNI
jgi:oxygen-independent coproporphyrinogen-3 oxidase